MKIDTNAYMSPEQLEEIEKKLKETKVKLEQLVKEYPLTSVALAFAGGYLLSKLINKGRS